MKAVKNFKKAIQRKIKITLIQKSPSKLRDHIIRSAIHVPEPKGKYKEIIYKVAQTRQEREEAYRLVQSSYEESGICEKDGSKLKLNKFHLLPTTTIFIAKYQDKVIATLSQITDSGFGLPIDNFTDIKNLRDTGAKICEFSSLAIDKKWRSKHHEVYIPFTFFVVNYCQYNLGIDYIVSITRADVRFFQESLFGFKSINNEVKAYKYACNKSSFAQYLDLNEFDEFLVKNYTNAPKHRNFLTMYTQALSPWKRQWLMGEKKYAITTEPNIPYEDFKYFFSKETNLFEELTDKELLTINNFYFFDYNKCQNEEVFISPRKEPRFSVNMPITLISDTSLLNAKVIDISKNGFLISIASDKDIQENLTGKITLEKGVTCKFRAEVLWRKGSKVGCKFTEVDNKTLNNFLVYADQYVTRYINISEDQDKVA